MWPKTQQIVHPLLHPQHMLCGSGHSQRVIHCQSDSWLTTDFRSNNIQCIISQNKLKQEFIEFILNDLSIWLPINVSF